MKFEKCGIIIKTCRKDECIAFYKIIMKMQIVFENEFLTCFDCNGLYIMIEPWLEKYPAQNNENIVLRFNVESVIEHKDELESHGIPVDYATFDWGEILAFSDPAGTRIELKDSNTFNQQVLSHQKV
jgi:lactoylglutathione lyase